MSAVLTIASCIIIAVLCTVGVFTTKYDDTLFQRITLATCSLSSLGVGYQIYLHPSIMPAAFDFFVVSVAMWAISIFLKYRR